MIFLLMYKNRQICFHKQDYMLKMHLKMRSFIIFYLHNNNKYDFFCNCFEIRMKPLCSLY